MILLSASNYSHFPEDERNERLKTHLAATSQNSGKKRQISLNLVSMVVKMANHSLTEHSVCLKK